MTQEFGLEPLTLALIKEKQILSEDGETSLASQTKPFGVVIRVETNFNFLLCNKLDSEGLFHILFETNGKN